MLNGALLTVVLMTAAAGMEPKELVMAGEAYAQGGQGKKAIPVLKKAMESGKLTPQEHSRALVALGLSYSQLEQHDEARKAFEDALQKNPDEEKAYVMLGMTLDFT